MIPPPFINNIFSQFVSLNGKLDAVELTSGLINNTYKLNTPNGKTFLLQKINTKVFHEYDKLMTNVFIISEHINKKLKSIKNIEYVNPEFYTTLDKRYYYKDDDNNIWRLSEFIDNNKPDLEDKKTIANEAGKILATFHFLTNDIDTDSIYETIPGFHNIKLRWNKLLTVTKKNNPRYNESKDIFNKIRSFEYLINEFEELMHSNSLPLRIVHNDPKLSNILFRNNKAISLIDPDTIMPGYLPADFGDAVRSLCNTTDENETNIEKVGFDIDSFQAFTKSYLEIMNPLLISNELNSLAVFPLIITMEQLIRFYTDYIEGDIYYQTNYPKHNLNRSLVQLKLLESMSTYFEQMQIFIMEN